MSLGCVAYKLGGSLLDLPDLVPRLRRVWEQRPGEARLLVVGGGPVADVVRQWDRTFGLGDELSHWLAIDALDLTANLLLRLMPELQLVRSQRQMEMAHEAGRPALLCATCFMKWLETQANPLPHTWDVTTDSISAAAAVAWRAQELVLLKSCEGPPDLQAEALVSAGLVDAMFAQAARGLGRISWVNLRGE